MRRLFIFCVCLFMFPAGTHAQDSEVEISGRINRLVAAFRVARVESKRESSELELVEEQSRKIETLSTEYQSVLQEYAELIDDDNQVEALSLMVGKLPALEKRLRSDILLPHQDDLLQKMVFDDLVRSANGNVIQAVAQNYSAEFNLTDAQSSKLKQIEAGAQKEVAAAKRKFEEELKRIARQTQLKTEQVLSPDQREKIQSLRNRAR